MRMTRDSRQQGLSIIEVMVALAASMVVIGAVVAFAASMSQATAQSVRYSRINQDVRASMDLITRELRRAGSNVQAIRQVGRGQTSIEFSDILVGSEDGDVLGECVMFGYDSIENGVPRTPGAVDDAEWRGFRRSETAGRGFIEMRRGGGGIGERCDSDDHDWVRITDPSLIDITLLEFDLEPSFRAIGDQMPDPGNPAAMLDLWVEVRIIDIRMEARLVSDPDVVRTSQQRVRVRADRMWPLPPAPPAV
jgi:prepilin peptidase dependent protein B